jgi:hypothetical protein
MTSQLFLLSVYSSTPNIEANFPCETKSTSTRRQVGTCWYRAGWSSCKVLYMYSEVFTSSLDWTTVVTTEVFRGFPPTFETNSVLISWLFHHHFHLQPFQFINRLLIRRHSVPISTKSMRSRQLRSCSRTSQHFTEPEGSLPCSQGPSPESSPYFPAEDPF